MRAGVLCATIVTEPHIVAVVSELGTNTGLVDVAPIPPGDGVGGESVHQE